MNMAIPAPGESHFHGVEIMDELTISGIGTRTQSEAQTKY